MKRSLKITLTISFTIIILIIGILYAKTSLFKKSNNDLININELSDKFMNDYFEGYAKLQEQDNKENILIVTSMKKLKDTYGATDVVEAPNHQFLLQYKTEEEKNAALEKFKQDSKIEYVSENIIYQIANYNSWGISKMGLDYSQGQVNSYGGEAVTVAIIDTGCDMSLFNSNYSGKIQETYNVLNPGGAMVDEHGHGTHIAGTIAEATPNNVKILPVKVSTTGSMSSQDIVAAINYIVKNKKADVINMSFTAPAEDPNLATALLAAKQQNIIGVAAAGNDNSSAYYYPAANPNTISISAVNSGRNLASFSNYGSTIDFAAPGVSILSINGTMSGTSMAAPHVASAVAVLKSFNKSLSFDNTKEVLKKLAVDIGTKGRDNYFGYGFIDFSGTEFCKTSGTECDEYGIFTKSNEAKTVKKFEIVAPILTTYNYGTDTNLSQIELKIYYSDTNYYKKYLYELDDVEILNYNPNSTSQQTVTIKYKGLSQSFDITQPSTFTSKSAWEYTVISQGKAKLTNYKGTGVLKINIPSKIDGYTITTLGENLFYMDSINEVILPEVITIIEDKVFFQSALKKIDIKAEEIHVGEYAFSELPELETINSKIASMGASAFYNDTSLNNITLSNGITEISNSAFGGCVNLENINIPNTITSIGASAFFNTNISSIVLPNGIKKIENNTFAGCYNLKSVTLPENLETIGSYAFNNNNIKTLYIPSTVTSIGEHAFKESPSLKTIVVDTANEYYDSRGNSNAIIETATNKLLVGTYNTIIPNTVDIIGTYAFAYKTLLFGIEIPEGVVEIKDYAFYHNPYIQSVNVAQSVATLGRNVFGTSPNIELWIYNDTATHNYLEDNNSNASSESQILKYYCFDPYRTIATVPNKNYKAFETLNTTGMYTMLYYKNYKGTNTEKISSGLKVTYQNNNTSFRFGDTYVNISGKNQFDIPFETQVSVTVSKATPSYYIPSGLTAETGQLLSEIQLPSNFSWMNPDTEITSVGTVKYPARYTPNDTINYAIVDNIFVPVQVTKGKEIISPNIKIIDKSYDGTTSIPLENIIISNLSSDSYTIEKATSNRIDTGNGIATIKIKLTNKAFEDYTLDNGEQECEYVINHKIIAKQLIKPTLVEKTYIYNTYEQEVELNNFDETAMSIIGNKRTNAGEQDVTISLNSTTNYIWSDGTLTDINLKFKIEKANPNIDYNISENIILHDGEEHGLILTIDSPQNAKVKFSDSNGDYILEESPKYVNIGTYIIKYKFYIDDNYNEIFEEATLKIVDKLIVNSTTDYETTYDGKLHSLNLNINTEDYNVKYSINNTNYNLDQNPTFKDVGEYTVNYKITCDICDTIYGSNKVKIYGIKSIDSTLSIKDNYLLVRNYNNSFSNISNRISLFAKTKTINHYARNNVLVTSDTTKTGEKIRININGTKDYEYTISVLGDINSDGKITSADYIKIRKHIMKTELIIADYLFYSADLNEDNKITSADYIRIRKKIMEGS